MSLFSTARFFTTVAKLPQLPRALIPELAFVGRSNAGKSSAINAICQRRQLARASASPGRTQALNYFALGPEDNPSAYLVDTPGYGYATAPLEIKRQWDGLAGKYLAKRTQLAAVVLVMDIRRQVTALDETLLSWMDPASRLVVIATKCDKLTKQEQRVALKAIHAKLELLRGGQNFEVIMFSADKRMGLDASRALLEQIVLGTSLEVAQ
jgi:GTP-binding protein